MPNVAAVVDELLQGFSRAGSTWIPAVIAGTVFVAATWSIRKQVKAILGGK